MLALLIVFLLGIGFVYAILRLAVKALVIGGYLVYCAYLYWRLTPDQRAALRRLAQ